MRGDPLDHKGLIYEAYRIEGITIGECRSIFLDWALSLPDEMETRAAIQKLLRRYRPAHPDHPMTQVLIEGDTKITSPRRRGGWRARPRN
ncbi:hypothetical protein MNBD_ALPHA07-1806 [hydrothermal vent metagenome]|uniref:Uncharacterized protein n=1 Tax=hydrothermal vent metagenome TaxID=652676 RepID=A0A3B0SH91_9ZZZZ